MSELKALDLSTDPWSCFQTWFSAAKNSSQPEPEAMSIATADGGGAPSLRIVLLKEVKNHQLYFYTNYNSVKGQELLANPKIAATFHWRQPIQRQIRIEGFVEKTSAEESDTYFFSRPRGSQISAWASDQSHVIESRGAMLEKLKSFEKKFETQPLTRPPHWGGFLITPLRIEFWQEGEFRFHDRIEFTRADQKAEWSMRRLSP